MIIRSRIDILGLLAHRHASRLAELADDWDEEGSQAAIDGNPSRAHHLQMFAVNLRAIAPTLVSNAAVVAHESVRRS